MNTHTTTTEHRPIPAANGRHNEIVGMIHWHALKLSAVPAKSTAITEGKEIIANVGVCFTSRQEAHLERVKRENEVRINSSTREVIRSSCSRVLI